ncbi:MAG: hypothetical protein KME08_04815 [Aphanothece sp. CMT-3BRIN-NPC111]|jgi:DNA repair exonuclease SbcCD ATPase subunit|nr:hypothetical protein [Aphanothece sp. CMT-3BRIN-NPC111]
MSYEVTDWLAQIRALKQQLAELQRDRHEANESAANWRQLYNTEAQQRRAEASLAQQQIEKLKAQIQQVQSLPPPQPDEPAAVEAIEQEVEQLQSTEELKAKLKEVLLERDRLRVVLKAEQAKHAQTRKTLTTAIADTIDKLARERATHQEKADIYSG